MKTDLFSSAESCSKQFSVREKLKLSLFKLLDMNYDVTDDSILSKLVSFLAEDSSEDLQDLYNTVYEEWLIACIAHWRDGALKPTIAVFSIQVLSIVCRNAACFSILNDKKQILGKFQDLTESKLSANPLFPIAYAKLLSACIYHDEGIKYALDHELWKKVLSIYVADESLYVKKECKDFLVAVCVRICEKNLEASNIVAQIFELFEAYRQNSIGVNKKYTQIVNLLIAILETFLAKQEFEVADRYFLARPGYYESLWFDFSAPCKNEALTKISKLIILSKLINLSSAGNINTKSFFDEVILKVLQRFLRKDSFREVALTCELTAKYCQLVPVDPNFLENLLVIRLAPVFIVLEKPSHVNDVNFDFLPQQFSLWQSIQNFITQYNLSLKQADTGSTAVSCLTALDFEFENPSPRYKLLIFKVLVGIFQKYFVPGNLDSPEQFSLDCIDCRLTLALLAQLKNSVAKLVGNPNFQPYEILPHLVAFLSIPGQPTQNIAPALDLVRQILEISPENPDVSQLQSVLPDLQKLLLKHMYSIWWEVRDSAIEVISSIADVSKNIPCDDTVDLQLAEDVLAVFTSDSEYYVRASAIACLSKLLTRHLWLRMKREDVLGKLLDALSTEDEAIVRRQIPLLLKHIYQHCDISEELLRNVYPTLVRACTKDLHWEVCVNALEFWRCVMLEHVQTTNSESIVTQLIQLNNVGCFGVIMKCLHNEADLEVCRKAAAILQELLRRLPPDLKQIVDSLRSRVLSGESSGCLSTSSAPISQPDERKLIAGEKASLSEEVIDSIVNAKDVSLLAGVYKSAENPNPAFSLSTETGDFVLTETELSDLFTINVAELIHSKEEFFIQTQTNLESLLNDILLPGFNNSENPILDCY